MVYKMNFQVIIQVFFFKSNLNVVKNEFLMFNEMYAIEYDDNAPLVTVHVTQNKRINYLLIWIFGHQLIHCSQKIMLKFQLLMVKISEAFLIGKKHKQYYLSLIKII